MRWLTITPLAPHKHPITGACPLIARAMYNRTVLINMKKEVIIAILIGFGIGLLITLGIHATRKQENTSLNPASQVVPTPAPDTEHHITLVSPLENSVQTSETVLVKGQTTPDSTMVLETEKTHQIKIADVSGFFEAEFPLITGPNQISITSYSPNGTIANQTLETTYVPEDDSSALNEETSDDES